MYIVLPGFPKRQPVSMAANAASGPGWVLFDVRSHYFVVSLDIFVFTNLNKLDTAYVGCFVAQQ